MNNKTPLSVAIITKNEAHNLHDCLNSIGFAEQIVVVDSGSSDDTLKIASEFGCHVYTEPWAGFGPQKQSAIDKCTQSWVLVLDADERIPHETAIAIRYIISEQPHSIAGYSFPRKNYFQGRWIKHLGWWPDHVARLFRKDRGRMSRATVHESVEIDGPVEKLDVPIEHMTESRLSNILQKIDHYSTLSAGEAFKEGRKATVWSAAFRAVLTFFQNYVLKLGFLDGMQGLTLSITDSVNKFFKYAKLSELTRQERENPNNKTQMSK